jgi:hypothetical protein
VILGFTDPEYVDDIEDPMGVTMSILTAGQDLAALVTELGEARIKDPGNDLVSALVTSEVDGEKLSPQELASFFILLVVAGNETTRNALAHGLCALTEHPGEKRRWLDDIDGLAPTAVEEIVRWASPVIHFRRTVTQDGVRLGDHEFAEGDKVVLVGCKIANPLARDPANPPPPAHWNGPLPAIGMLQLGPVFQRWTFDLTTGATREEQLDDTLAEFPRMDNRALGRPTRYSYHQRIAPSPTLMFDGVIKYDLERRSSSAHSYPAGWLGGETAFCPRLGATSEDDGYLCTFVVHEATGASELYVLDAKNVADRPLARIRIPHRVPTGYHTWWVSADDLASQRPLVTA